VPNSVPVSDPAIVSTTPPSHSFAGDDGAKLGAGVDGEQVGNDDEGDIVGAPLGILSHCNNTLRTLYPE